MKSVHSVFTQCNDSAVHRGTLISWIFFYAQTYRLPAEDNFDKKLINKK